MKTRTLTLALSLFAASMARPAITTHASPLVTPVRADLRFKASLTRAFEADHLSGAILVRDHGRIVMDGAYGTSGRRLTTQTSFTTPQLTSLFTQAALVRLVEQGKLPQLVVDRTNLGSGSGLRNAIRSIERASEMSFASYLQRYLFWPVHMFHTAVVQPVGAPPAVHTTVDDLDRWDQAALGCTLAVPPGMVWTTGKPWGWSPMLRGPITIRTDDVHDGIVLTQHILPIMPGEESALTVLSVRGSKGSRVTATVLRVLR